MIKSLLARALATASSIALGVAGSQALGQDIGDGADAPWVQVAAAVDDASEVGVTDVVQREAVGTLRDLIRYLQISDAIFFNETIETGPDSATRVSFLDDSSLSLGPSSRVVIDRFVYDPNQGTGEMAMSLSTGVFRFTSGVIDDSNYRISTPVSTIGIRGTEIDVSVTCRDVALGDCEIIMDVRQGEAFMDTPNSAVDAPQGTRVVYRPAVSSQPQVTDLPPDAPPTPAVAAMIARINAAVVDLIESVLPPGVTMATASPGQLSDAAARLAAANPRAADLLIRGIGDRRPDAAGTVGSTLLSIAPGRSDRVVQALSDVLSGIQPQAGPAAPAPDLFAPADDDDQDSPY